MTTTFEQLQKVLNLHNETFDSIIEIYPKDIDLNQSFDDSYGLQQGDSFYAWSTNRVYFKVVYDGYEWIESVPRNPINEKPRSFGG